ncbi:hypothetical protein [Aquibium oceanicum]|uniref:Uncharacterized protein n=1 Tax=Aquibium oceanicum TaxID=1670800 RepID=A0A1L3SXH6_9HYPH|nr:hypothetical protein [Aquibium oceanicum]APH74133.1 hypothetical protein BSQ44_24250 [Aquibium oceanicum]
MTTVLVPLHPPMDVIVAVARAWPLTIIQIQDLYKQITQSAAAEQSDIIGLLAEAERFIAGFEGCELQDPPVDDLLARIREVLA